ncbi:MAG TPA: succinate dehydrogenase hydrophobic membrane anchor subunit [Nitrolancea sp.]|jgi:succinate dehydrogenase / fumarate reductase membrane anchor subunit|nr:succinate dehydrogenase hydrophobic membrane anchor subunit [Nitrolancea sp.]
MTTPRSRVGRQRPTGNNFELYSWYFFRISGLLLIFLAVTHVVIMHVVNNVSQIDFNFVAHRWGSPFWRSFDWLLLILALLHGFNGARLSVDDYIRNRGWRMFAHSVIWSALIIFIVLGTIAIVTFDPASFSNATASAGR